MPYRRLEIPLWLLLAAAVAVASPASAQDTTGVGAVAGVVLAGDGTPASGVTICIVDADLCASSGADGAFRLPGVRAGQQHIEVRAPGLPPYVSGHVDVRAGFEATVEVALPLIDAVVEEVNVTAQAFTPPEEVKTSGFVLSSRAIGTSAGALQDVSRFTQSLPGVVIGSNDFRNDLIVRGGSPLENLFVVDNVEIPNINAFATSASAGGSVGLIDSSLLRDVTFLTGGYPAAFGNRVSSVLQIALREGDRESFRGQLSAGFLGAGGILEGPLGGKGSWIVSARRSFLDFFTDDIGIGGVPVIYAVNAKAVYDLSPRDRVWAVNVTGIDRLRLGATSSSDPEDSELANLDIQYEGWRSATGLNWQRVFGERGVGLLGITHSSSAVDTAYKDLLRAGVPFEPLPLEELIARSPVIFSEDSTERETTVKYDYTGFGRLFEKVQVGGAVKRIDARYDAAQPLGFDNPYSTTPGANVFEVSVDQASYDLGAYAQATWKPAPRVGITFGGRADRYGYTKKTRLSPRLGFRYRLTGALAWQSSYGIYYQQTSPLLLAAFPENRGLAPLRADHYVTGLRWAPDPSFEVGAEAYWKEYRGYPVAREYPSVTLANIGDTFDVRESLFPLASEGRGRSAGVELSLEKRFTGRWFAQANLAVSRTRHAGADGVLRPGAFDYPFVANFVGGYRLTGRWELAARFAYLAGRPYTPFDLAASTSARRGIYALDRVNGERAERLRAAGRAGGPHAAGGEAPAAGVCRRAEHPQPPQLRELLLGPPEQPAPLRRAAGALPARRHGVATVRDYHPLMPIPLDDYAARTPGSRAWYERARAVLPAGVSYGIRDLAPYPFYVDRAGGSRVWDVDGNEYTDYWCGHGALILGHAPAPVVEAACRQAGRGSHFGFAHPLEVELAEMVARLVPGAEMVRYTNSGTEANMYALALARAFTGRTRVAKMEGGWHGGLESLNAAVHAPFDVPEALGLNPHATADTEALPFNDLDAARRALARGDLAALFVEPMMGAAGCIAAERGYLEGLRELCTRHGTVLVFDEVVTGFRVAPGGAQQHYGVTPDIATLGKILGGGFPIGALCGRREVFERLDHRRFGGRGDRAFQGGTFSGNPVSLAAGLATLRQLEGGEVHERLDRLGARLRDGIAAAFAGHGVPVGVTGLGSAVGVHFRSGAPRNAAEASADDLVVARRYFDYMLGCGIVFLLPTSPHLFVSAAHTEEDIEGFLAATREFAPHARRSA